MGEHLNQTCSSLSGIEPLKKYFKNCVYIGDNAGAGMMVGQPDV